MTPQETLNYLTPAFRDLFGKEPPDLDRFIRLVIDVLDPASGYLGVCSGDGAFLPKGCGKSTRFQTAVRDCRPFGYRCSDCGVVYPFAFSSGPKPAPRRIVLTKTSSKIRGTRSESDSGVVIVDDGTVQLPDIPA